MRSPTLFGRVRSRFAHALAPPWRPEGGQRNAYFTYAKSKTVMVAGMLSYPIVDAVVLAADSEDHQYYQFGYLVGAPMVASVPLPYQLGLADLLAAIVTIDCEVVTHYRFIRLINSGLRRDWIPWKSRTLWNLRTVLIAYAVAWRMRAIAKAHQVGFVSDFYSATMLGVTLAFRREGHELWDIQHGRIGPAHQAYNAPVFKIACGLRPTGVVVWDRRAGAYVERELKVNWVSTDYAHLRVTGAAADEASRTILYTLQVATPIPSPVVSLIRENPFLEWRLRPHPGGRNPESDYLPLLALPNVSLSEVQTPLADDLRSAAVHVTWNSSVVMEAASLGVRSVLMEERASLDFADEVASGYAVVARPEALASILADVLSRAGRP